MRELTREKLQDEEIHDRREGYSLGCFDCHTTVVVAVDGCYLLLLELIHRDHLRNGGLVRSVRVVDMLVQPVVLVPIDASDFPRALVARTEVDRPMIADAIAALELPMGFVVVAVAAADVAAVAEVVAAVVSAHSPTASIDSHPNFV
jgi:hypothetical protein